MLFPNNFSFFYLAFFLAEMEFTNYTDHPGISVNKKAWFLSFLASSDCMLVTEQMTKCKRSRVWQCVLKGFSSFSVNLLMEAVCRGQGLSHSTQEGEGGREMDSWLTYKSYNSTASNIMLVGTMRCSRCQQVQWKRRNEITWICTFQ